VGFVLDKAALRQGFLLLITIPSMLNRGWWNGRPIQTAISRESISLSPKNILNQTRKLELGTVIGANFP
jgi:hypothetical protein